VADDRLDAVDAWLGSAAAQAAPAASPALTAPAGLSDPIKSRLTHINMNTEPPHRQRQPVCADALRSGLYNIPTASIPGAGLFPRHQLWNSPIEFFEPSIG
jgi:hypothetical protein